MSNNGIIQIHGRDYMTVARRVEVAHEAKTLEGIDTEIISHNPVVIKAKVTIKGKLFTGISSVSLESQKLIEKQNPYEVAETSAIGRALGFAGYGLIEGICSADDMIRATSKTAKVSPIKTIKSNPIPTEKCMICGAPKGKPHGTLCTVGKTNN